MGYAWGKGDTQRSIERAQVSLSHSHKMFDGCVSAGADVVFVVKREKKSCERAPRWSEAAPSSCRVSVLRIVHDPVARLGLGQIWWRICPVTPV